MTAKDWMKDVLIVSVGLAAVAAISAFLLATDRIQEPASWQSNEIHRAGRTRVSKKMDALVYDELSDLGLKHSQRASDQKIARRMALALTGSLPSFEELRELEKVAADDRVDWYVSHLLEDRRCSDYLAERFARAIVGVDGGPFVIYRRRRFVSWLSNQLHANRPYDDIAREILTDNGLWTDSPAVNFYTGNIIPDQGDEAKPDAIRLAGRTSRAFLGMRIDCLQCHDDFMGTMNLGSADDPVGGTQLHFHSLASFFSQVENSFTGITDDLSDEIYQYKLLDAEDEEPIRASVPFNSHLDDESEQNLRIRLANWTTHPENRPFARSVVNRVWAIMLGRGLVNPVDNIPLEGPFPPVMELLVDDFVANNFDIHRLIRTIVQTDIFQRESSSEFEITDRNKNTWAVFPITRLRPEQVAGAIIQSTSLKTINSTSHIIQRLMKFGEQNGFVERFGDLGEDEFNQRSETITQRLVMLNGEMITERLQNGLNSTSRIAILSPDLETAVNTVYLATLSRQPDAPELGHFIGQLESMNNDEKMQKIKDIYWTLINSTEFGWNH